MVCGCSFCACVRCSSPLGSDNLGFINICNEVKGLLFAALPQIERIFEPTKRRIQIKPKRRRSD
jgi:hypothetical protein